jgi:hypothetical protein
MSVIRPYWPKAAISRTHKDNWIVARWGFVRGVPNYAERDLPACGSPSQGIQWGKIYAGDPDPENDGTVASSTRTLNVFNTHWAMVGTDASGSAYFCLNTATVSRDFMSSPLPGLNLSAEPSIVGGDLNIEDVIRPYQVTTCEPYGGHDAFEILRQAGFNDTFTSPGAARVTPTLDGATGMVGRAATETCYRNYSHNGLYLPYKRIDHQLARGGAAIGTNLRVVSFELIGVEQFGNCVPSDHMGTKVRYEWF